MASTRFHDDEARIVKALQQSTDVGRWILNAPGNGLNPYFFEDPFIRQQKWAGNLHTNAIDLEGELMGNRKQPVRDCYSNSLFDLGTEYAKVQTSLISCPSSRHLTTDQSRATDPAWHFREKEHPRWSYLPLDPQENIFFPRESNLNTRIIEKDNFTPKRDQLVQDSKQYLLPTNFQDQYQKIF